MGGGHDTDTLCTMGRHERRSTNCCKKASRPARTTGGGGSAVDGLGLASRAVLAGYDWAASELLTTYARTVLIPQILPISSTMSVLIRALKTTR